MKPLACISASFQCVWRNQNLLMLMLQKIIDLWLAFIHWVMDVPTWEVPLITLERLELHLAIASCNSHTSLGLRNLLHASTTWWMQANHEPLILLSVQHVIKLMYRKIMPLTGQSKFAVSADKNPPRPSANTTANPPNNGLYSMARKLMPSVFKGIARKVKNIFSNL